MATYDGNDGVVKAGSNAVAEVLSFSLTETSNMRDRAAIGDDWDVMSPGSKTGSGSVTCWYDDTDTDGQNALANGASVSLVLFPLGETTGRPQITVAAIINEVGREVQGRNQTTQRSFSFHANEVTHGTVSE